MMQVLRRTFLALLCSAYLSGSFLMAYGRRAWSCVHVAGYMDPGRVRYLSVPAEVAGLVHDTVINCQSMLTVKCRCAAGGQWVAQPATAGAISRASPGCLPWLQGAICAGWGTGWGTCKGAGMGRHVADRCLDP